MKNGLSKLAKDRVLITAMCTCILLITAAALISMYNKNRQSQNPDDMLSENQTQEQTANETQLQQAEAATEETETKNLIVKIETLPEPTQAPEIESSVQEEPVNVEPITEPAAETPAEPVTEPAAEVPVTEPEPADAPVIDLNFTSESSLLWPVNGEIIREFSMDTTVWFSTLKQYKCSDAIQIQSVSGTDVLAPANAQVIAVGSNDELGSFVVMDLGNGYRAECAQLTDITVNPGDFVAAGDRFAAVSAPTYYYTVDGDHLYFQLTCNGELLDPLDYLQ